MTAGGSVVEASRRSIEAVVVTSPGCHFCEEAIEHLESLTREFPLSVRVVEIRSPEGRGIVEMYRPPMPPAVLIDGRLFSSGRLPRRKLRRFLEGGDGR